MIAAHCACILLMAVITLWKSSRAFALSLCTCKRSDWLVHKTGSKILTDFGEKQVIIDLDYLSWYNIREQYKALKIFSEMINRQFGHIVTLYLIKVILYYAISLNKVADWIKMLTVILYFCGASAILLFSADVCRQVHTCCKLIFGDTNANVLRFYEYFLFNC